MDYFLVCLVSLVAAGLTLFSGFGLGTILLPAFALFFPLPAAVVATAVVHLVNNLFKVALVGRQADRRSVIRFAVPAALAAVGGATLLAVFAALPPLGVYQVAGRECQITLVKLVMGIFILAAALCELIPSWSRISFDARYLPIGGALSGFFGGLSGHQGALRSAFLIRAGLGKEAFIATGVVSAVIVDTVRLAVYGAEFLGAPLAGLQGGMAGLVAAATLSACCGSLLGARLIKKVTLRVLQSIVGAMLAAIALAMAAGLV